VSKFHLQIVCGLLTALFSSGFAPEARAEVTRGAWVPNGQRVCSFDGLYKKTRCTEYYQQIKHTEADGMVWSQFRYKWISGDDIVIYFPTAGMLYGGEFTTGYITTLKHGSIVYKYEEAASYSASREEAIIGIPNEGYSFSVTTGP
jgi:hypothetical protein